MKEREGEREIAICECHAMSHLEITERNIDKGVPTCVRALANPDFQNQGVTFGNAEEPRIERATKIQFPARNERFAAVATGVGGFGKGSRRARGRGER